MLCTCIYDHFDHLNIILHDVLQHSSHKRHNEVCSMRYHTIGSDATATHTHTHTIGRGDGTRKIMRSNIELVFQWLKHTILITSNINRTHWMRKIAPKCEWDAPQSICFMSPSICSFDRRCWFQHAMALSHTLLSAIAKRFEKEWMARRKKSSNDNVEQFKTMYIHNMNTNSRAKNVNCIRKWVWRECENNFSSVVTI